MIGLAWKGHPGAPLIGVFVISFFRRGDRMGIVVFGATLVDIKGYPVSQYIPGGRNVGKVIQVHGGVSRNVAEDIANVQLFPTFISVVDRTGISTDILDHLKSRNVDIRYVQRTEDGLGTWLAIFSNQGDVIASISKRPELGVILDVLREHGDEIIQNADSVVVEIDMELEILERIFELTEKYGKKVFAVVSNMSIAMERRNLLRRTCCLVCNEQEAAMLFSETYDYLTIEELIQAVSDDIQRAGIYCMVVTLGERGSVYVSADGENGYCPSLDVEVVDTTGAGDAFFAGTAIGLTYGKSLAESCRIATRLASSVIMTRESVCPEFQPQEFGIE